MSKQTTTTSSKQQMSQQQAFSQQQQVEEQMAKMNMSEEEFKQHQKMKRLEAEAQEEVRQTLAAQREAKMRKLHPPEPPKPKEIMVIAGDGKPVKVQLGGEAQEDSRKQVAEAAGLKHVPLPDFDGSDQSAWAGSLKKTSKTKIRETRQEMVEEENPWAGSLRHVTDKPRKGGKKEASDDLYGGAPWRRTPGQDPCATSQINLARVGRRKPVMICIEGVLGIVCLIISDIKVIIAYSSVVHMALIIVGSRSCCSQSKIRCSESHLRYP